MSGKRGMTIKMVAHHSTKGGIMNMTKEQALKQLQEAHDALSKVLEDDDAGNDEVRDRAIDICDALNAFWDRLPLSSLTR